MKKCTHIILALLIAVSANAQIAGGKILIRDFIVDENGGKVVVSFTADIMKKSVNANNTLAFAPVLTNGSTKVSMPPVVVLGKKAKGKLIRHEWVAGDTFYENAVYTTDGAKVNYSASADFQHWMHGAELVFECLAGGCNSYVLYPDVVIVKDMKLREEAAAEIAEEETLAEEHIAEGQVSEESQIAFIPETLADTLSVSFPFVVSMDKFDASEPFKIYDDERENSLIVYYTNGSSSINKNYKGNEQTLMNLTTVIRMIMDDSRSEVENIVIGGFASPDGSYDVNDRLAFERAVSVKKYIMETTGMPDEKIMVYNGSVDWKGLRHLVSKSNIQQRDSVIDIIDNVPVWDSRRQRGRLGELMRLNSGVTYRYLYSEFFPLLRSGSFIKVYYTNK